MEEFEKKSCEFYNDNNTLIDFEKYTLLGKYAKMNACDEFPEKKVVEDSQKKVVVYTINVVGDGNCSLDLES